MFEFLTILSSYVQQFGAGAPAVAFILFVIQAAIPIFPYLILAAGGGMIFGFKIGALLAWSGALVGACVNYWFCRLVGYETVSRWLYKRYGYDVENSNASTAFWSIVISLVIPFLPSPLVSAAAAFGGVSFLNFLLAVAIGKIPTAVLYTGLGLALFKAREVDTILLIIAAAIIVLLGLRKLGRKYSAQQKLKIIEPVPPVRKKCLVGKQPKEM